MSCILNGVFLKSSRVMAQLLIVIEIEVQIGALYAGDLRE